MDQMAPAEGWETRTGKIPRRRRSPGAAGRLRRMWRAGVGKTWVLLLPLFLAATGTEHDTAAEMTLRSANALLKRQGTPSRYSGKMSHYVAGGCFLRVERKGLARGKTIAHKAGGFLGSKLDRKSVV